MKRYYRGFTLEANREECLAGYDLVYEYGVRDSDGWILIDSCHDDRDTLTTHMKGMVKLVDDYFEHPEEYEGPDETIERLKKELHEARVLATWFFRDCVAPYGFAKDKVKGLRKRFPWLKQELDAPVFDALLQEVEI